MTPELVECVPNVSEGRDVRLIRDLADTIELEADTHLLDIHSDADHHRSVFTYAGPPESVERATLALAAHACDAIDLRMHRGQHRRIGAVDVIPFIPISSSSMERCVQLAGQTAARVAAELGVPAFLYGHAARSADRSWLPSIRGKGFETLASRMNAGLTPDYGPQLPHPSAGAVAVGARDFLLAFNVFLNTTDVEIARRIAGIIRTTGGGLPGVQSLGLAVAGYAQVSMNLFDLGRTSASAAFDAVRAEADAAGVAVLRGEIVGLAPSHALPETAGRIAVAEIESKKLEVQLAKHYRGVVLG